MTHHGQTYHVYFGLNVEKLLPVPLHPRSWITPSRSLGIAMLVSTRSVCCSPGA